MMTHVHAFRQLVGKLIYLTITNPDITYTMGLLSQFMHAIEEIYWQVALCVLAYLKHAPRRGLLYLKHDHLRTKASYESIYASDRGYRKSIFGYCTFIGGTLSHGRVKNNTLSLSLQCQSRTTCYDACFL